MRLDLSLSQRPEMQLRLSPQLIQRIEILQLPTPELMELVQQECSDNDVLDVDVPRVDTPEPSENGKEVELDEQVSDGVEQYSGYNEILRPKRNDGERDPKMEAMANAPAQSSSLREHLLAQVGYHSLPDKIRAFVEILIDHLDENGFLPDPVEELRIPFDEQFSVEEAHEALEYLKTLDPVGVGARDMVECFEMQLDPTHVNYDLHRKIVTEHLDDWRDNRMPTIQRSTGVSIEAVKAAMLELRDILSLPPGRQFREDVVVSVRPDVVVEKRDGDFNVRLEDDFYPDVGISPTSLELYRNRGVVGKARRDLKGKIERARFLMEAIQQRKETLHRVALEIVGHQREFFESGRLLPLKMRDVADTLGLHVSTVSRAISDKWMQTPRGIFPLKSFFTGAAPGGETSGLESRDSVRNKVSEIVEAEDKARPLSDEEIVEKLKALGLSIARRTVTKYRKMLNIPSSRQRREY